MRILAAMKRVLAMLLLALFSISVASAYDLTINKVDIEYDDYDGNDGGVLYDFKTNTMQFMAHEKLNEREIKITIYNYDSSINRMFIIYIPQQFYLDDDGITLLCCVEGRFEDRFELRLTRNLFTESGLIEGVIYCKDIAGNDYALIINENSKILCEYKFEFEDEDHYLGDLVDPSLVGGKVMFENGFMLNPSSSGINAIATDVNKSVVTPNPTNGAAAVVISWDYELLEDGQLNVIDLDGRQVYTQSLKAGTHKATISTSRLAPGNYIYVVQAANGYSTTGKLVVN